KTLEGTVKSEDAKIVVVTPLKAKNNQTIPSTEILDIINEPATFGTAGLAGGPYREAQKAEKDAEAADAAGRKKFLSLAIVKYDETLKAMKKDAPSEKLAARNLEYKMAMLTVTQAADDKAIAKLQAFKDKHGDSCQI